MDIKILQMQVADMFRAIVRATFHISPSSGLLVTTVKLKAAFVRPAIMGLFYALCPPPKKDSS
jgi:hypothetical protein